MNRNGVLARVFATMALLFGLAVIETQTADGVRGIAGSLSVALDVTLCQVQAQEEVLTKEGKVTAVGLLKSRSVVHHGETITGYELHTRSGLFNIQSEDPKKYAEVEKKLAGLLEKQIEVTGIKVILPASWGGGVVLDVAGPDDIALAVSDPELNQRIAELIRQLGADDFNERDDAQKELIRIGRPALAQLDEAKEGSDDAEIRMRCSAALRDIRALTPLGKNEQGYEEYRHEMTGMIFVKVPGGTFKMGSDDERDDEKPVHEVKLDGFLIAKHEVTQAVWQKVIGNNPSMFKGNDNPVEQVSWNDCQEFCKKAGLRLPTEAEWEYACRAGTNTMYFWGDNPDGAYMWSVDNSGDATHPVGQRKPNGFGLYDMIGNVSEWCEDWYDATYYLSALEQAGKNSPSDNPTGPVNGEFRLLRGGWWGQCDEGCSSAVRSMLKVTPNRGLSIIGFRCVVSQRQ